MSFIREVFGAGTFMGIEIPFMNLFKIPILAQSPGGFLVYGILIAIMNKLTEKKGGVKKKSFSCEGCPSAAICQSKPCVNGNTEEKEDAENDN
jgi:electron transport complex protein RnfE